jgi:hypothetical protein
VGQAEIGLPSFIMDTLPFVSLRHSCPRRIGVGDRCQIDFLFFPSKFQFPVHEFTCAAESSNVKALVKMQVELSEGALEIIRRKRFRNFGIVVIIGSLPILLECWQRKNEVMRVRRDWDARLALLRREVDRLSVSKRSSLGIQTSILEVETVTGGRWVRIQAPLAPASSTSIACMDNFLHSFQ